MFIQAKMQTTIITKKNQFLIEMLNNTTEAMTYQQSYHKRNKEKCLERGRCYYEENKDRLQKMARDKYKALSEEEKNKKRDRESNLKEYGKNLYKIRLKKTRKEKRKRI